MTDNAVGKRLLLLRKLNAPSNMVSAFKTAKDQIRKYFIWLSKQVQVVIYP